MTINLSVPQTSACLQPRITVIGVGGAGGNAVNNMINSHLEGVEFLVANTDAQALAESQGQRRIQLGLNITNGLGAGSRPDIGRAAAEEAIDELVEHLQSVHMVFVTAGMGGGTGTGAAPVIARLAREHGILTVGVVTKPFQFEGANRMRIADAGIEEMQQYVDTLIVIPNQNLFRVANEKTTFAEAFAMADEVLHSGVRGVTDLMVVPGLINLDFADIRTVMGEMGKAMMGTGESDGEERARLAAEAAISNPLLDEVSMKGARGVLINITGGPDMTLFEVDEAANRIGDEVDSDANIIFGSTMDPSLEGRMRVSVVATGIDAEAAARPRPVLWVYSSNRSPDDGSEVEAGDGPEESPSAEARSGLGIAEPSGFPGKDADDGGDGATATAGPEHDQPRLYAPAADTRAMRPTREPKGIPRPPEAVASVHAESGASTAGAAAQEAFMPPPAVDPLRSGEVAAKPDPFREADLINGGASEPARKRGPSLFQRMTGTGKPRKAESEPPAEAPATPTEAPKSETEIVPDRVAALEPGNETPKIEADSPQPAPRPQPPQQPRLEGVAHREPLSVSQAEEDLLDIPAFLRRQAN